MTNSTKIFQRVQTAFDLERLQQSRIISVGCGGAALFLEELARCGVGEFVLIDPDLVEKPNIATQQTYIDDIGRSKVDCIAERIYRINPNTLVDVYQQPLDDIDDEAFADLAFASIDQDEDEEGVDENGNSDLPLGIWGALSDHVPSTPADTAPGITILCGFTDNFYAQARVNRLALQFGIPSLCAQLYQYGQSAEITFTFPGVTPACQRCILSPRYKAYLENGYQNTIGSAGAPIFATTRVNALKGMIAMSLLHHGTNYPAWGDLLSRNSNRTLVQLRMHPDTRLSIFNRVFAGADTERIFFDEAVWLPQEADPTCPDCGGTGDLRKAIGAFSDTRLMRY